MTTDCGRDLDPHAIAFFLLRRNLDALLDWLLGALDNQQPDAQRRADLDGVRWCLACLDGLDERIRQARAVSARHRRRRRDTGRKGLVCGR